MTWRGSSTVQDRIIACLVYLIPLLEVLPFGGNLFDAFPPLNYVFLPLILISPIYFFSVGGLQIVAIALFIGLYAGVVRNEALRHFLRFNTMQALLLAIIVFLFSLCLSLIGFSSVLNPAGFGSPLSPIAILLTAIFVGIVGLSLYCIVRCVQGLYAEIPVVSEAAYTQTRY